MSRIGKNPIAIPAGVDVVIDGQNVTVKGPSIGTARSRPASMSSRTAAAKCAVRPMPSSTRRRATSAVSTSTTGSRSTLARAAASSSASGARRT